MHGLINRSIQCFLRDSYDAELWGDVAAAAGIGPDGFEAMLEYDDVVTHDMLAAASARLGLPVEAMLEDLGTYLVSHQSLEWLRRLLRFGGVGFVDFLYSLDDLPGRARLAVPELDLPQLELKEEGEGCFALQVRTNHPTLAHVMLGVLRAMADDYGALVLLEVGPAARCPAGGGLVCIDIHLLDHRFAEGRRFELAAGAQ